MPVKKLKAAYISALCGELYDTVSSGISISDGIYMLMSDGKDDPILKKLFDETSKGRTFAAAVKHTESFPDYMVEMIKIGEQTGRLDSVLRELSAYYARQNEISQNIKNAITFPIILLVILIIIVVVLLTQVLPIFNDVFRQLGVSMSGAAVTLMNIGNAIRTYAVWIISCIAVIALVGYVMYKLPGTHDMIVNIFRGRKLKRKMSSSVFASAMAMTISSGMDIDESLEMSKKLCDKDVEKKIDACQNVMKSGVSFDKAVQKSDILDPISSRRLTISFRTGRTDEAMKKIADDYAEQVNTAIDEKISRVEPALVVIMSVLVGFVLFSVMLPMLSVITAV
ncbi:MAG: type II secretion system F family protein [Oscillospiraceae bacterium]|nr:type II secretion system F family protein [Oscillospiraceae bacterium]